jgi:hypothetical protein
VACGVLYIVLGVLCDFFWLSFFGFTDALTFVRIYDALAGVWDPWFGFLAF